MPEAAAADGAAGQQQRGAGSNLLSTILRMAFMWYLMNWMRGGNQQASKEPGAMTYPKYGRGDLFDMYTYISESPYTESAIATDPIWIEKAIHFATDSSRHSNYTYYPSTAVQNNGSVYLHAIFVKAGLPVDPTDPDFQQGAAFKKVQSLVSYLPKPKEKLGVNLLSGEGIPHTEENKKADDVREIISFWKPNMTVAMVDHFQPYNKKGIPPQIFDHMVFDDTGNYYPIAHFEEFWLLRDKLIPLNDTVSNVTLQLELKSMSFWWWQLQLQMDQSFKMQVNTGLSQDGESDELKRVLLEGNPYLLALTFSVSLLHSVFDFLAFKNDIGFWKDNKSMEGLSARSIIINAVCQLVIFLYLCDNETSFVVLISSGIGTAIEFWKVTKAMDVTFTYSFPFVSMKDRSTYVQSKTKQYDQEASRYLSYVLYPLVIGYSIYSLYYEKHKSWYSWVLGSLVGAVYMFGFILMCPQLYLNYKLKSVAHLPWRQMTYKFLNTIIDDLFAFVIKMPTLHRLSVFRDDIIFLIYLYQRWIYRVDKTRANEFGWVEQPAEQQEAVEGVKEEVAAIEGPSASSKKKRKDAAKAAGPAEADADGGVAAGEEGKKDS